jgi:hypothetical protein
VADDDTDLDYQRPKDFAPDPNLFAPPSQPQQLQPWQKPAPASPLDRRDQDMYLRSRDITGSLDEGTKQMLDAWEKQHKEELELTQQHKQDRDEIMKHIRGLQQPELPKLKDIPSAPPSSAYQFQNPFLAFQNPGVVLATMASFFTRQPLTAAFNTAASAMKGFHQGDKEAIDQNVAAWKDQVDQAVKQNKLETDKYTELWNRYHDRYDMLLAEMQAHASSYKDDMMLAQLKYAGPKEIWELIEHRQQAGLELEKSKAEVEKAHEEANKAHAQAQMYASGMIDDETARDVAEAYVAGNRMVLANWGRGNQGANNLAKIWDNIKTVMREQGKSGADLSAAQAEFEGFKAGERTIAQRSASIDIYAQEARQFADLAEQASSKVPRGNWVPYNRAYLAWERGTSSPEVSQFVVFTNSLVNAYTRASIGLGGSVTDREHSREMLEIAQGPKAYMAAVDAMKTELDTLLQATGKARESLTKDFQARHGGRTTAGSSSGPVTPPAATSPAAPAAPAATTGDASAMSDDELRAKLGLAPGGTPGNVSAAARPQPSAEDEELERQFTLPMAGG